MSHSPLGPKVPAPAKAGQHVKRPAQGAGPTRRDVVVGPDGMWRTQGYQPVPVYTKREPKP